MDTLFTLIAPSDSVPEPGELVWQGPHPKAAGAWNRRYRVSGGHLMLTFWRDALHCVVYQPNIPPTDGPPTEPLVSDVDPVLFAHYGDGMEWSEILDNGYGKTFRRQDKLRFALWSYVMNVHTFGTMAFHEVMWG